MEQERIAEPTKENFQDGFATENHFEVNIQRRMAKLASKIEEKK
jgi:hypothetical protein